MAKTVKRKITDYTPDPANANKGTERGVYMLEESLSKFGAGRSILVDKNGVIIAGNKTGERAADLGITDVVEVETDGNTLVVVKRTDLDLLNDDDQHKARGLAYADNRAGEVGLEWDAEQLLADVTVGVPLDQFWHPDELKELLEQLNDQTPPGDPGAALDRAEKLRDKWSVERGLIWQVGRHRLMCGDAYSAPHRAGLLNGQTPSMLHIDPPYGVNIVKPGNGRLSATDSGAKPFGSTSGSKRKSGAAERSAREQTPFVHGTPSKNQLAVNPAWPIMRGDDVGRTDPANIVQSNLYPPIEGDDRPFDPSVFLPLAPIVVMWGANNYADKLPLSQGWIVWDKREDITRNTFADCELAWTNQHKPARLFHHLWNGLHKGSQHGERRTHPTEKPVALFAEIGKMLSSKGLWLDLFAGTGAQVVAAEQIGATCFAIEWEPLYVAVMLERLSGLGLTPELVDRIDTSHT